MTKIYQFNLNEKEYKAMKDMLEILRSYVLVTDDMENEETVREHIEHLERAVRNAQVLEV